MLQLSENLKLISIDENTVKDGILLVVVCYFTFFGEEGIACISLDELDEKESSYGMTEISAELASSFNDILDDEDNWMKIVAKIRDFIKEWETENVGK